MSVPSIIRKSDLAALKGVSRARVSVLIRRGLPVRPDGFIDRQKALDWWNSHVAPVSTSRTAGGHQAGQKGALAAETGDKPAEATNGSPAPPEPQQVPKSGKLPSGKLVLRKEVEKVMFEIGRHTRARLVSIPDRLSETIAGTEDPEEIRRLLDRELRLALEALSAEFDDQLPS